VTCVARSQGRKVARSQGPDGSVRRNGTVPGPPLQPCHSEASRRRSCRPPRQRRQPPGLNEYRWQPNRRSVSGFIGDALDELEELRRLHDRVREPAAFDQSFLGVRRAEIGAVRYALRPHE